MRRRSEPRPENLRQTTRSLRETPSQGLQLYQTRRRLLEKTAKAAVSWMRLTSETLLRKQSHREALLRKQRYREDSSNRL